METSRSEQNYLVSCRRTFNDHLNKLDDNFEDIGIWPNIRKEIEQNVKRLEKAIQEYEAKKFKIELAQLIQSMNRLIK